MQYSANKHPITSQTLSNNQKTLTQINNKDNIYIIIEQNNGAVLVNTASINRNCCYSQINRKLKIGPKNNHPSIKWNKNSFCTFAAHNWYVKKQK